jgi:aminopeptidase
MSMTFDQQLEVYANLIIEFGVALQPHQRLLINATTDHVALVRACTTSAYQRGARHVAVFWRDDGVTLARHRFAPRDSFAELPAWYGSAMNEVAERGDAIINIAGTDPKLLEGQDAALISLEQSTLVQARAVLYESIFSNSMNFSVAAAATPAWARSVFPNLEPTAAVDALWQAIFQVTQVNQPKAVEVWQTLCDTMKHRRELLQTKAFDALRFSGPGTKLEVGLHPNHIWMGGQMTTPSGITFMPNVPTYEVYTAPHRLRVNGTVRGTKPASLDHGLVEGWALEFKDGRVIHASADRGKAELHALLETDEGARFLGEVALLPAGSPVEQTNLLFQNILFDENAACHIALGRAYAFSIQGANGMGEAEFVAMGGNFSEEHMDVMIGSSEVDVKGIHANGREELILEQGQWVL